MLAKWGNKHSQHRHRRCCSWSIGRCPSSAPSWPRGRRCCWRRGAAAARCSCFRRSGRPTGTHNRSGFCSRRSATAPKGGSSATTSAAPLPSSTESRGDCSSLSDVTGMPVSIIGWSMGGVLAKASPVSTPTQCVRSSVSARRSGCATTMLTRATRRCSTRWSVRSRPSRAHRCSCTSTNAARCWCLRPRSSPGPMAW